MFKKLPAALVLLMIFFSSCRTKDVSEYGDLLKPVMITDEGHLRGVSIGDDIEKVKNTEQAKLVEEESDYLYYDQQLNEDDFLNVAYYFDHTGLYEIMLDVTFEQELKANELFTSLHNFYTERHGNPKIEEGYYIWKTTSEVSTHIEIALKNTSPGNEKGFVTLIISNFDY